jgi:outer membrane protein OmpA-like peptidoglycan-associated protein
VDSRPSFDVEFKRIEFPQGKPDRSQAGVSVEDILSDEEIAVLWELRTALLEHRFLGATVTGYADDHECQADVCRELSLRRASLVLAWLLKHGVPDVQLRGPASESTDFPLNPGETEDDRARNRRVQLLPFVVPGSLPGGH